MITEENVKTAIKVLKEYTRGDPPGISAALLEELEQAIEAAYGPITCDVDESA